MTWPQLVVAGTIVWWLVLFMVLPFGIRPQADPEPGTVASAPDRPRLLLRFAITTVIALVITAIIWWVVDAGLISFRPPPGG